MIDEVVARVIAEVGREDPERLHRELRRALRDAYPFGPRKYWPYRVWLEEVKKVMWRLGLEVPPIEKPLFDYRKVEAPLFEGEGR